MRTDAQLIESWLTHLHHNRGRSPTTVGKYRGYLARLVAWLIEQDKRLGEATDQDLEAFSGLVMHREGLSPRSRRALVAAIRGFYSWAVTSRAIGTNPAAALPYPKSGLRLPVAMQLRNAERLLMEPDIGTFMGVRDAAMLALMMGCGLRISGLLALNQSDLTFTEVEGVEWLIIRTREKGNRERLVPAPHEARLLVRAYLGHHELEQIDRTLPDGDQVLFVGTRNRSIPEHEYRGEARRLKPRSVRDMVTRYGEAAGIPRDQLYPHAMRHLYGTELAEEDVDLLVRQTLMGHASPTSTKIYTHLAARKLTKAVRTGNPLAKINTPVSDLMRHLEKAT
jgi:site-specific recombinase XerD